MKTLTHKIVLASDTVTEPTKQVSRKGIGKIRGCISVADVVNANNFIIPYSEMVDMLNSPVNQARLKEGKILSCVGHDDRPVEDNDLRHGEISHVVTNLWLEGKELMMEATLCDTESGRNIKAILMAGGSIQASTRLGIVPDTDPETGADSLIGSQSVIYAIDLVTDPAISETYIELVESSKKKSGLKTMVLSSSFVPEADSDEELESSSINEDSEFLDNQIASAHETINYLKEKNQMLQKCLNRKVRK